MSYFTATLLLFDNLMFKGKSLKLKKFSRIVIFILSKKNRDSHFIQNRSALGFRQSSYLGVFPMRKAKLSEPMKENSC